MQKKCTFLFKDPWRFSSQNDILHRATDQEIKELSDQLLNCLPKAIFQREEAKAIVEKLKTDDFAKKRAQIRMAALLYKKNARDILKVNPRFYGLTLADIPFVCAIIQNTALISKEQKIEHFTTLNMQDTTSEEFLLMAGCVFSAVQN